MSSRISLPGNEQGPSDFDPSERDLLYLARAASYLHQATGQGQPHQGAVVVSGNGHHAGHLTILRQPPRVTPPVPLQLNL